MLPHRKESSVLVINVTNFRYRDQKQEDQVQYVSTRASPYIIISSGGNSLKKSSSATTDTENTDIKEERDNKQEDISQTSTKGKGKKLTATKREEILKKFIKREGQMETASKNEEISETGTTSDEFRVVQIPDPRCEKFPPRHFLTDVVVRKIRDCLWSSPSDPPPILTPSCLCYIRKKGDLFEDVIEKLQRETEIGVSGQLETRGRGELARKGTLSLLSIATNTTVFIFDILEIGEEVFKWGLGAVLTNSNCVKITHDARLLREAFFDGIIQLSLFSI